MDQAETCVNDRRWAETAKEHALIGGGGRGGEYFYIFVSCPANFSLKSTVIATDFKRNSSGRTRKI